MSNRTSTKQVSFQHAFVLSGYSDELPAGVYEVLAEEELLQGLSFEAYRRTSTCIVVGGKGETSGRAEMRPTTEKDLEAALVRDQARSDETRTSGAALSPLEDME